MNYFAFQWHITEACDQRCKHCYIYALGSHAQFKEMTTCEMKDIIDNIETFCAKANRLPYIYITGGDPILHPQFWLLAKMLKEKSIPFAILGNPFHLNDENCKRLVIHGCTKYQLSLDGLEDTHDRIRRKGSYKETLQSIPILKKTGLDVAIMTTVSKWNFQEIPELIDVVVENRADVFAFARYCPDKESQDVCCTADEYHGMMEKCWTKFQEYKDSETYFSLKDHLWTLFKYEKGLFNPDDYPHDDYVYEGCNCGNSHITILPDGGVYACRRMESKVGNALQEDLFNIFTGDKMDRYRIYEKFEKCNKCNLLRFCRGCPAVAYGYSGDMYSADPQCWKAV